MCISKVQASEQNPLGFGKGMCSQLSASPAAPSTHLPSERLERRQKAEPLVEHGGSEGWSSDTVLTTKIKKNRASATPIPVHLDRPNPGPIDMPLNLIPVKPALRFINTNTDTVKEHIL